MIRLTISTIETLKLDDLTENFPLQNGKHWKSNRTDRTTHSKVFLTQHTRSTGAFYSFPPRLAPVGIIPTIFDTKMCVIGVKYVFGCDYGTLAYIITCIARYLTVFEVFIEVQKSQRMPLGMDGVSGPCLVLTKT